jgi:hypothetical protein
VGAFLISGNQLKLLAFLTLALILSACSDDPKCEQSDSNVVDCAVLVEADCLAEAQCIPFYGSKIDTIAMCAEPEEMIVCGNIETADCPNNVVGYVIGPNGTCWIQSSSCFSPALGYESGANFSDDPCPLSSEPCP